MTQNHHNGESDEDLEKHHIEQAIRIERNWAIAAHVGGLFGSFVVPLLIWFLKRDEYPLVRRHAKEALNFHMTMLAGLVISGILIFIWIGYFLLAGLILMEVVLVVRASLAADKGENFRYPVCIRVVQ